MIQLEKTVLGDLLPDLMFLIDTARAELPATASADTSLKASHGAMLKSGITVRGRWQGKVAGATRASVVSSTKAEAVQKTKELAKAAPLGQIKIHKGNGQIQTEYTYGQDPRRYKS